MVTPKIASLTIVLLQVTTREARKNHQMTKLKIDLLLMEVCIIISRRMRSIGGHNCRRSLKFGDDDEDKFNAPLFQNQKLT